ERQPDIECKTNRGRKTSGAARMRICPRLKLNPAVRTDQAELLTQREIDRLVQRHRAFRHGREFRRLAIVSKRARVEPFGTADDDQIVVRKPVTLLPAGTKTVVVKIRGPVRVRIDAR